MLLLDNLDEYEQDTTALYFNLYLLFITTPFVKVLAFTIYFAALIAFLY